MDAATRSLLAEAVANRGHQVTAVATMDEAAQWLQRGGFDCFVFKLRQEWAAPLERFMRHVLIGPVRQRVHVLAVALDDPPERPQDWLAKGVDDCVLSLAKGRDLDLRLAVAEKRLQERRQRAEEQNDAAAVAKNYENLFLHAPSAVLVVAARDGLIIEASEAVGQLLGLPLRDVRDKFVSLLIPSLLGRDEVFMGWDESRGPLRLTDLSHRRPDGAVLRLEVEMGRCFWSDRPTLWLRFEDVTPASRARAAQLRAARLDAVRSVAAGASSTLNDALTAVRGNIDLLAKQNTPRANAQELLESAAAACERAEETVRTLAGLARASHVSPRRRRLDLRAVLSRSISLAALKGPVRPEFFFPDDLWPVEADEAPLKEAVHALLENAGQAMPAGGSLRIRAANLRDGSDSPPRVAIEFSDDGEGIPPSHIPRIFDPYFSTRPGRQGLGLAQVLSIITAHEGAVEVESSPGQGTVVRLILPALDAAADAPAGDSQAAPAAPCRGRVLVMDDDAGIRVIVEKMLSLQGFEVYTVRDGAETINAYRRAIEMGSPFDVVLLDLEVRGGMGGRECIARLRGEFPGVKALLSTGFSDDAVLENHREHGFSGVITKPFNVERLVNSVSRLAEL